MHKTPILRWRARLTTSLLLACFAAVTGSSLSGCKRAEPLAPGLLPTLLFDDERGFFGTPFPSDARVLESGAPDFAGLPNPEGVGFLDASIEATRERDGFDPHGAVYFRFDRELPLPSHSEADTQLAFPGIEIIDVDERSPERLRRFPAWVRATARHDGVRPAHLLQVLPVPGVALREGTTYAVIVRRDLDGDGRVDLAGSRDMLALLDMNASPAASSGAAANGSASSTRWHNAFAPLRATLEELKLPKEHVAAATVFTTGTPTRELFQWVERALAGPPPELVGSLVRERDYPDYVVLRGTVRFPLYQEGTPPHMFGGGRLITDDDGSPVAQGSEAAPFYLTVPKGEIQGDGIPLYFYVHGTGGLATQAIDRGYRKSVDDVAPPGSGLASWVAPLGFGTSVVAGTYSPDRIGWRALDGYGAYVFMNPVAMRDNLAQMVLEQVLFLRLLEELVLDPALVPEVKAAVTEANPNGHIRFSRELRVVGGQSLGSFLSGMLAALTQRFEAAVLTGAGGSWIEFGFGPKDPVDLTALLEWMAMARGEKLDRFHPMITAFQTAVGPADNTHYVPYIVRRPRGEKVPHVLIVEGQADLQVPVNLQRALVLAVGADLVGPETGDTPEEQLFPVLRFGGLRHVQAGLAGNRAAPDGSPRTSVVVRHPEDGRLEGHYVIFQQPRARAQLRGFLEDVAAGRVPEVK